MESWGFVIAKKILRNFLELIGSVYLIFEICQTFIGRISNVTSIFWLLALICFFFALTKEWPRDFFCFKIKGTDTVVEVISKNIFSLDGIIVVPINNKFQVDANSTMTHGNSIQAMLLKDIYYGDIEALKEDIGYAIRENGMVATAENVDCEASMDEYPIGTTLSINRSDKTFILLANTRINNCGRAFSQKNYTEQSLNGLWEGIAERSKKGRILIPLIGTGNGRVPITRENVFFSIVESFIQVPKAIAICEKLTIVINPKDIKEGLIDPERIIQFVEFKCNFPEKIG